MNKLSAIMIWIGMLASISLGTVSSSSEFDPRYLANYAFDGKTDTRWASKTGQTPQWLMLDMGESVAFQGGLTIHWEHAYAAEYEIQVSDDNKNWTSIYKGQGKDGKDSIANLDGTGRYWRIWCAKTGPHNLSSIWEIEFDDPESKQYVRERMAGWEKQQQELKQQRLLKLIDNAPLDKVVFAVRKEHTDGHWYANFAYYAESNERKCYAEGGRLCLLDVKSGEVKDLLEDDRGGFRDPAVHYNGRTLVFAWRRGGTGHYHLYTMDLESPGEPVQITDGNGDYDDIEPAWLPDGDIVFVSSRCKRWVNCWLTQVGIIYRCRPDGSQVRQLSANTEHDNTPWVLPDGRILYMRWEYIDRSQVHYHHLWTMNPDGTNQTVFFGNQFAGNVLIDARPLPNSPSIVAIRSPGHGSKEHTGHIAIIDPKNGPDDIGRMRDITGWGYRDPFPLTNDTYIAARGREIVLVKNSDVAPIYQIPADLMAECTLHEPRPVQKNPYEQQIVKRTDWSQSTGTLVLTNVYEGRNMAGVNPGEVKKLLVIESLPKPINYTGGMEPLSYGGTFTLERVVGTVPVEADGSANFELPPMRSFFFIALNDQDQSIKRMQSFTSVMPGEVNSCVGCHEPRTQTPVNNFSGGKVQALNRPASLIQPVADVPDVFDFPRHIQPILDRHCVKCHNPTKYAGRVILTGDQGPLYSIAYYNLSTRGLIADGRNLPKSNYAPRTIGDIASRLMKKVDGNHNDTKVSLPERRILQYWINTGAPWPGTYAALGCGMIGGYSENQCDRQDLQWPEIKAAINTINSRCGSCHQDKLHIPRSPSDDATPPWNINYEDIPIRLNRHRLYNLSHPDLSPLVLAPLAKSAGGWGMVQRGPDGKKTDKIIEIFKSKDDPDYQILLKSIERTKRHLDTITRFNMPNFKPRDAYLREMKRYGILATEAAGPFDVYNLDRLYWESLWYQPELQTVNTQ